MTNSLHIALTGHRPNKLGGYNLNQPGYTRLQHDLEQFIEHKLGQHDTIIGHSGLALGADTIWSKAILAMREKHPGRVLFHAEIPFMQQHNKWFKQSDIDFWFHQVNTADDQSIYMDDNTPLTRQNVVKALNDRNIGMIEHSDLLIAVWDKTPGGTGNAVKYAKSVNKDIQFIDPSVYFK